MHLVGPVRAPKLLYCLRATPDPCQQPRPMIAVNATGRVPLVSLQTYNAHGAPSELRLIVKDLTFTHWEAHSSVCKEY